MDMANSGSAVGTVDDDNRVNVSNAQEKEIISETISSAFNFAVDAQLSRRHFATWLCCWFGSKELVPDELIKWLCLNTQKRREAETDLVTFVNKHTGMFISTKRILRQNRMSRSTNWQKTLEKSSGLSMPTAYYNRVCRKTPNRFLYGALRWLALSWSSELLNFENCVNDANARLEKLQKIEAIPVIEQSPVLPFSIRNLMNLHEMGENGDVEARKLEESLQNLRQLERNYCEEEKDGKELIETINQKCQGNIKHDNINNLFELLIIVKSASALKASGWKISNVVIDEVTSKPIIEMVGEGEKEGFGCKISKAGIGKLDLCKPYRGRNSSGFEPDVVYIFYRKRKAASDYDAVVFLGDAKYYTSSGHDVAVCGKLLNVFAFARALGLTLDPCGGFGSGAGSKLIQYHIKDSIPVPSFMFFFPTLEFGKKDERTLRNVTERFSLDCFDCDEKKKQECKCRQCPGNVADSFYRIFNLIRDEKFDWPLRMTQDGELEFNSKSKKS